MIDNNYSNKLKINVFTNESKFIDITEEQAIKLVSAAFTLLAPEGRKIIIEAGGEQFRPQDQYDAKSILKSIALWNSIGKNNDVLSQDRFRHFLPVKKNKHARGSGFKIQPQTVLLLHELRMRDVSVTEIAKLTGLNERTVRKHTSGYRAIVAANQKDDLIQALNDMPNEPLPVEEACPIEPPKEALSEALSEALDEGLSPEDEKSIRRLLKLLLKALPEARGL
jgi:hypothetical protein